MGLVSSTELLNEAVAHDRSIVAPNVFNSESAEAAIAAAEELGVPVIVSLGEPDLRHMGLEQVVALVRARAQRSPVPIVLHLDHGSNFNLVVRCIHAGFTSVMMDVSHMPPIEGRETLQRVVEIARAVDVTVESMVGSLKLAVENGPEIKTSEELTDPDLAREFAQRTSLDSLAVSVGTEHGAALVGRTPEVDMARLEEIGKVVDVPLVVHGGSGITLAQLAMLRKRRVGKVNTGTAIRLAFHDSMRESLCDDHIDISDALRLAQGAMQDGIRAKMQTLTA